MKMKWLPLVICALLLGSAWGGSLVYGQAARTGATRAAKGGQTAATGKGPVAEDVFKNIQVLRGTPVDEFMGTMGIFSVALGMSCEDCHAADDSKWENFAVDNPKKRRARSMVTMMAAINKTYFNGRQGVTCFSCHRGADRPKVTPNPANLFAPVDEPSDLIITGKNVPTSDEIFDKYIQAMGGSQRLAAITSFVVKGTSSGYGPESGERAVEIYAKAPGQRTMVLHTDNGDSTSTYNGTVGWVSAPLRPIPVMALAGQGLEGAKFDAELAFPQRIKQVLRNWRVGYAATIDDKDYQVVQGTSAAGMLATLYFDPDTGLLARTVRYANSPVGRIPTQTDYSDYREVSGVKIPFRFVVTWLDGKETYEIKDVQVNAQVDAARFNKPAPPVTK
jgi:photosynthetic reaction center cytochrome c subunit